MSSRTKEETRAYQRGYSAGGRNAWPSHRPPLPPHELLAAFVLAARELRDAVDSACATFSEDDEFVLNLNPKIDALDNEMTRWTAWLREEPKERS